MIQSHWYVLHVQTGKEEYVAQRLRARGFNVVVPVENRVIRKSGEWTQTLYTVFAGYIFVYMVYSWGKYYAMSGIDGIIKILPDGKSPTPLSKNETKFILYLTERLDKPSVLRFDEDGKYEALSGFLLDYKDYIVEVIRRSKKAKVEITIANVKQKFTVSFIEDTEQTQEQRSD